jgi:prephenate dehydrogenase
MPPQARVCIIGLGLIGGSLALAMRRFAGVQHIVAVDADPQLTQRRVGDRIDHLYRPEQLAEACSRADVIFLATPIATTLDYLHDLASLPLKDKLISDVGSIKGEIVAQATRQLPKTVQFIGGHPMAGSERGGFAAADPFLFENALYVLTPGSDVQAAKLDLLSELLRQIGAHILVMSAARHDQIAATVSHLPQVLAVSLMRLAARHNREDKQFLQMAAGGFRDMTRIASSPYGIWRDILNFNRSEVLSSIDQLQTALKEMADILQHGGAEQAFAEAAEARLAIPSDTRGFLNPLFDLAVEVEDKHGVIAEIATELADAGINIRDIEVLKVRENEGGRLRLSVSSRAEQEQAVERLLAAGYRCSPVY